MTGIQKSNPNIPSMSAQHFNYIAAVMADIKPERPSKKVVVDALVDAFTLTNPNFRADWFRDACYGMYPSGKEAKR